MVLFHHIIEVFALTQTNPTTENALSFQPLPQGELRALRKKRWAAAASRLAVSRNSIV